MIPKYLRERNSKFGNLQHVNAKTLQQANINADTVQVNSIF